MLKIVVYCFAGTVLVFKSTLKIETKFIIFMFLTLATDHYFRVLKFTFKYNIIANPPTCYGLLNKFL